MGVRYSRRRRFRRFNLIRPLRWLAIFALVGFSICFPLPRDREAPPMRPFSETRSGASASTRHLSAAEGIAPPIARREKPVRAVYPYSVIPGGVESVEELKNAIASDSVVSAHYATFDLSRARMLRLDGDRSMHVSYRLGSKVYWTKRELKLTKGETLITDGVHTARTRCGNLISNAVPESVSQNEPTVQEMDTPLDPQDTGVQIGSDLPPGPSLTQTPGSSTPTQIPGSNTSSVEVGSPPRGSGNGPNILGPHSPIGPGSIGAGPWPTLPSPTHVVAVPEPRTLLLLLIGLFALMLLPRRGAQRSRQHGG
jgi:hypothetical protein